MHGEHLARDWRVVGPPQLHLSYYYNNCILVLETRTVAGDHRAPSFHVEPQAAIFTLPEPQAAQVSPLHILPCLSPSWLFSMDVSPFPITAITDLVTSHSSCLAFSNLPSAGPGRSSLPVLPPEPPGYLTFTHCPHSLQACQFQRMYLGRIDPERSGGKGKVRTDRETEASSLGS